MSIQRRSDLGVRRDESGEAPEVVLDVPRATVDEITLELDGVRARIALDARIADLVVLHVGAEAEAENVAIELKGAEAEAHLHAHLANVVALVDRALRTVDEHPEVLADLARRVAAGDASDGLGRIGAGSGRSAGRVQRTARSVGNGRGAAGPAPARPGGDEAPAGAVRGA